MLAGSLGWGRQMLLFNRARSPNEGQTPEPKQITPKPHTVACPTRRAGFGAAGEMPNTEKVRKLKFESKII